MQELINVFKENNVLILAIVIVILALILLGYLLTSILFKKKTKQDATVKAESSKEDTKEIKDINKKSLELEEMLGKMQDTLDKKEKIDAVSKYESEQEENAIISYQELLKAAKKDFPQMEKEEVLEPEVLEVENPIKADDMVLPREEKKFKNSVFISPIYGTKANLIDNRENTVDANYNKDSLEYENEMNEKFLDDLKDFRNNL